MKIKKQIDNASTINKCRPIINRFSELSARKCLEANLSIEGSNALKKSPLKTTAMRKSTST